MTEINLLKYKNQHSKKKNIAQMKSLFRTLQIRAYISHEYLACLVYTSCTYSHPLHWLVKSRCYVSYLVPRRGESALSRALMKATFWCAYDGERGTAVGEWCDWCTGERYWWSAILPVLPPSVWRDVVEVLGALVSEDAEERRTGVRGAYPIKFPSRELHTGGVGSRDPGPLGPSG